TGCWCGAVHAAPPAASHATGGRDSAAGAAPHAMTVDSASFAQVPLAAGFEPYASWRYAGRAIVAFGVRNDRDRATRKYLEHAADDDCRAVVVDADADALRVVGDQIDQRLLAVLCGE